MGNCFGSSFMFMILCMMEFKVLVKLLHVVQWQSMICFSLHHAESGVYQNHVISWYTVV